MFDWIDLNNLYLILRGGINIMIIILLGVIPDEQKDLVDRIFSELNARMYQISYNILKNRDDVEEAISETFLKIIQNVDQISTFPDSRIEIYCIRILKNETINVIRKRKNLSYIEDMDKLEDPCDIEGEFLKSADLEILKSSINRLTDIEQDFIHLRFFENNSLRDIANLFDITEEAAKKRSQRIIKKLREYYYERGDDNVKHNK